MKPIINIYGLLQSEPMPSPALMRLAGYIADYIAEEQDRGNTIDKWVIANAIEAYEGGAE